MLIVQGLLQFLIHGQTYNRQYWTMPVASFENYSYVEYSCKRGLSSFIYDSIGAGLTTRPKNASDVQLPTVADVAVQLGEAIKSNVLRALSPQNKIFKKIVSVGHSLGSGILDFIAITRGDDIPFDAYVVTGLFRNTVPPGDIPLPIVPARVVDPARWGNLDPAYLATPVGIRSAFYSRDNTTYSPRVLALDELTKDAGSEYLVFQGGANYFPAHNFTKPVFCMVGSMDQINCGKSSCNETAVRTTEQPYWPKVRNFSVFVSPEAGHDLNLDFFAGRAYQKIFDFVTRV